MKRDERIDRNAIARSSGVRIMVILIQIGLLAGGLLASGCGNGVTNHAFQPAALSSSGGAGGAQLLNIQVEPAQERLPAGIQLPLTATGQYADNSTRDLTNLVAWTSSSAATATITSSGVVMGCSKGNVTLTAALGGTTGQAAVEVTDATLQSIGVRPENPTMVTGSRLQMAALAYFSDHSDNDVTGQVSSWASSNLGVATVSTGGEVVAVAPGTAQITATALGISGSTTVTVTSSPVTALTVSPKAVSIAPSSTANLTATGTCQDGSQPVLTGVATWSSSNKSVATVNTNGVVTGLTVGTAAITATYQGKSDFATVSVSILSSLTVSPGTGNVAEGAELQYVARDARGILVSGVQWTIDDVKTATINPNTGLLAGVKVGDAVVTARIPSATGTAPVKVGARSVIPDPPDPDATYLQIVIDNRVDQSGADGRKIHFSYLAYDNASKNVAWLAAGKTESTGKFDNWNSPVLRVAKSADGDGEVLFSDTFDVELSDLPLDANGRHILKIPFNPLTISGTLWMTLDDKNHGLWLTSATAWSQPVFWPKNGGKGYDQCWDMFELTVQNGAMANVDSTNVNGLSLGLAFKARTSSATPISMGLDFAPQRPVADLVTALRALGKDYQTGDCTSGGKFLRIVSPAKCWDPTYTTLKPGIQQVYKYFNGSDAAHTLTFNFKNRNYTAKTTDGGQTLTFTSPSNFVLKLPTTLDVVSFDGDPAAYLPTAPDPNPLLPPWITLKSKPVNDQYYAGQFMVAYMNRGILTDSTLWPATRFSSWYPVGGTTNDFGRIMHATRTVSPLVSYFINTLCYAISFDDTGVQGTCDHGQSTDIDGAKSLTLVIESE